jgi:serine/threonine-protein kinase
MLLNGRYHVIKALKSNGPGTTFLAEDAQVPEQGHLAVKQFSLPSQDLAVNKLWRDLVYEQLDALANLAQMAEWLPKIVDVFEDGGRLYVVREWVEGIPLSSGASRGGVLTQNDIKELLGSVLDNLCDLHENGQIHGNLKPSNIVIRQPDGEPVLVDVNLMAVAPTQVRNVGFQFGSQPRQATLSATSAFAPPEQQVGNLCHASDLYSLALCIVYLLTRKLPHQLDFDAQTGQTLWRHYVPEINPDLADVLDIALSQRPEDRYVTAMEMLEDMQAIASPPLFRLPALAGLGNAPLLKRGILLAGGAAALLIAGMSIRNLLQVSPSAVSSSATTFPTNPDSNPLATQSPTVAVNPSPVESPGETAQVQPVTGEFSEQMATTLINRWLQSKQQIFAPPFNRDLVTALTADPLQRDILRPNGPIDWLQANNARYQFRTSQVESLQVVEQEGERALVEATITEDRTLIVDGVVDATNSGLSTGRFRYLLQQVDGQWRVADYQSM